MRRVPTHDRASAGRLDRQVATAFKADRKARSSRCDYILGMDWRMFSNVSLRDPRLFSSDHLMVLGKLQSATRTRSRAYLRARTRFPLRAPKNGTRNPSWCAFPSTWLSSNGNSSSNLFVVLADREERLIWDVDTKGT